MEQKIPFDNDYYVIDKDYRLISFNQAVADRYKGIKVGDFCYEATMNRNAPCLHCPIAGNSDSTCPIYFDPFYNDWVEAIFSDIGDGKYSVTCHAANESRFKFIGGKRTDELRMEVGGSAANEKLTAKVQEQMQIIESFNNIFFQICLLDLKENKFRLLSTDEPILKAIGYSGDISDKLSRVVDSFVVPECKQAMQEFSDLSTMNARLKDNKVLTLDYQGISFGWARALLIPTERDENGDVTKVLYCLRSIKGIKERELRQQAALEEQMAVIKGLAEEYYSILIVDYLADTVRIYRELGKEGSEVGEFFRDRGKWSEAVTTFAEGFIPQEDREEFVSMLSLDKIRESTEDYSFNFQKITKNGITHSQCRVAYGIDRKGCQFAVVGSKNVDREYQAQAKLQQAQQEIVRSYSLIEGLSHEYHTVWYITTADHAMHLFRSSKSSAVPDVIKNAEIKNYDIFIDEYVKGFVVEQDKEHVRRMAAFESLMSNVNDKGFFTINYLRRDSKGVERYHQMAFARSVEKNGGEIFVLAFRDVDSSVREEQEKRNALRDALAAAEHANHAKTTFLNNMSHDIRTPMNAIIGFTSLAAAHIDNIDQVKDYLGKIQISGKHLLSLINDVLDMSRIESGKVMIDEKENHLPEIMHDLRTIMQSDISAKQLEFFIDTVDVVNEDVICDKLRINQVMMNILGNAVKFTRPGGIISLRLIQKPCDLSGFARYEFKVKDTGIGMSRDFIEHIFEPFERESTSTVSGIQGTGLGMSITKNIVDMMGGTISVESELGKGTEVTVELQLKICGQPVKYEKIPELQGLHVLVADDDSNTCMSVCKMLASVGMRSEWTSYAKEAVIRTRFAIEQGDEFNAYIIDWLMPDMNGIELVRRIRRIIGEHKPIIILTAYDWADIEEEAREAGVTAFCSKPLFMSELRDILCQPFREGAASGDKKEDKPVDFTGKKILLVEDNELNQEIALAILSEVGFVMDVASDGEIAVDKMSHAEPGQYDLILMDIQMPVMDGYEATRQIRALPNKAAANIPIIAMTANAFNEDKENAIDAGMNGHISKPIETQMLLDTLADVLRSSEGSSNGENTET